MSAEDNQSTVNVSKDRRISMPLALLFVVVCSVAAGAVVLNSTRDQVARNTADIVSMQAEIKSSREILIRIDENVKALKETRK